MYSPEQKKKQVQNAYGGVAVALVIALGVGYYLYQLSPKVVPPPVNGTRSAEIVLGAGCELRVALPGEEAEVWERPRRNDLVIGTIPHNTPLAFGSVRVDWVEVTAPVAGWVSRRDVAVICPPNTSPTQ